MGWLRAKCYRLHKVAIISIFIDIVSSGSATTLQASTSTASPQTWHCSGPYSDLVYRDCEGQYYNTTGCYFLPHFAQYRACAAICNDVIVNSIGEQKCQSYCSDYLHTCKIASATTTRLPTSKSSSLTDAAENTHKSLSKSAWTAIFCSISAVVLIILVAVAVVIRRRMVRSRRSRGQQRVASGVQVLEDAVEDEGDEGEYTAIVDYTSDIK